MHDLLTGFGDAPCVFVVGKGGVGKTTTAGALALASADAGATTHLITTDPAESLGDLFGVALAGGAPAPSPCTDALTLEAFEARSWAERWLEPRRPALAEIVERGTYLAQADIDAILALAVPGVDEAMGALRLVQLAAARTRGVVQRIIVDTAPTGHTLRLLEAGTALASWVGTLRAMARKAAVVASSLMHVPMRLQGERVLDEIERDIADLDRLLDESVFVVVYRSGELVRAETERLTDELARRGLRVAAFVTTGPAAPLRVPSGPAARITVPLLGQTTGCQGLRTLARSTRPDAGTATEVPGNAADGAAPPPVTGTRSAARWLSRQPWRLLWFAGKGGVGKSTCAAAAALGLAADRQVALHSTDPAGSLSELFGTPIGDAPVRIDACLRAQQVDAPTALEEWRSEYREEVRAVFGGVGLEEGAVLDRRVIESALDLAPLGIDEIVSLDRILDSIDGDETLVIDTAPTGHFLRLLEMPGLALDWAHALLRILLHHGGAGSLDDVSARVLGFAKRLKVLRSTLADPQRAAVFVVTLDEPMVLAETERLRAALRAATIPEAGVIVNRARAARPVSAAHVLHAPGLARPPAGAAALRSFFDAWELV